MKSISLQQRQHKSVLHALMNHLLAARGFAVISALFLVTGLANGQQQPPELEPVSWILGANVDNSGIAGGLRRKLTPATAAWNAGATSSQGILRDGQVVFKAAPGSQAMMGLNQMSTTDSYLEIDFAIYVIPTGTSVVSGTAQVYQNGSPIAGAGLLGTYSSNTEFTIRRTGSTVEYLKDGVVEYTSLIPAAGKLLVDCSLYKPGSLFSSVQIGTGDLDNDGMADAWEEDQLPTLHSWTDIVNFKPLNDNDLDGISNLLEFQTGTSAMDSLSRSKGVVWDFGSNTKNIYTSGTITGRIKKLNEGSEPTYDSRAISYGISGDGELIFKVTPGTILTVGLDTSFAISTSTTPDVEWSISTGIDGKFTLNPNATDIPWTHALGLYSSETVFCIRRTADRIQFLKDGVLLHTAAAKSYDALYPSVWLSSPTAELTLAIIKTGDMDRDGMPDLWERQYLPADIGWNDLFNFRATGDLGNADGIIKIGETIYPTGDVEFNADEFKDGTSPIDPLSRCETVTWRADDWVNVGEVNSESGVLWKKIGVPEGYNTRAFGEKKILEDGVVNFEVSGRGGMAFGLNSSSAMPKLADGKTLNAGILTPDLEWSFNTLANGTYTVKPNTTGVVTPSGVLNTYNSSTRFSIQRVGGVVRFLRNGVIVHTAAAQSSGPLYVNVWLSNQAQSLTLARVYTGDLDNDEMPDSWELSYLDNKAGYAELDAFYATGLNADPDGDNIENLDEYYDGTNPLRALIKPATVLWKGNSTTPANLASLPIIDDRVGGVKKVSAAGWTVDAVASKLADVNNPSSARVPLAIKQTGRLSFTAKAASTLAVGLTYSDNNRTQNDLEFMIQLAAAGTASVFEGTGGTTAAVLKVSLGSYNANTRFSIRRVLGQIQYLKDGLVYYTSTTSVPASAALFVDASFNTINSEITTARLYTGDVDADGMEDEWEITQYQRLNSGNLPTYAQLDAFDFDEDEDKDGANNLEEYLLGTDPLQQLSVATGITWANFTSTFNTPLVAGTSVAPGYLRKTTSTPTTGYAADATSAQALTGDGTYSFTVLPGVLTIGFTSVAGPININNADTDLPYAILFSATDAKAVRPETATDLSLGAYTASTVLK